MLTYRGSPVFSFRPDWSLVSGRQLDELRIESAGAGLAVPWSSSMAIRRRGEFSVQLRSADEVAAWVAFFDGRKGRRKGFWVPTWLGDFRLLSSASASATEITIEAVGIGELIAAHGEQFRHLAIVRGEVWLGEVDIEMRRIVSVSQVGASERLQLDGPLSAAVDHREALVCPLIFARFAEDEFRLAYESGGVARAQVGITELPTEYEAAHDGDAPVWLYEFTRGNDTWRYADWGADIVRRGETWQAASIAHDEVRSNAELLAEPVEIRASGDDVLRALVSTDDLRRVTVSIWRTDADADPGAPIELGYVGELSGRALRPGGEFVFTAETRLGVLGGEEYPRTLYQRGDNEHVYGSGVDEAAFTVYDTVSSIGPDWIEASGFGAKAAAENDPQWFAGGVVEIGDQERYCRYQDGARLYLSRGFGAVSIGDPVSASAGYDRSLTMRADRFGDAANHRGFPYMPDRNLLFEPLEVAQNVSARKK